MHLVPSLPLLAKLDLSRRIKSLVAKDKIVFIGGDFNFTTYPEDRLNREVSHEDAVLSDSFEDLHLHELYQPVHTRDSISASTNSTTSARLDRIYVNFSQDVAQGFAIHNAALPLFF